MSGSRDRKQPSFWNHLYHDPKKDIPVGTILLENTLPTENKPAPSPVRLLLENNADCYRFMRNTPKLGKITKQQKNAMKLLLNPPQHADLDNLKEPPTESEMMEITRLDYNFGLAWGLLLRDLTIDKIKTNIKMKLLSINHILKTCDNDLKSNEKLLHPSMVLRFFPESEGKDFSIEKSIKIAHIDRIKDITQRLFYYEYAAFTSFNGFKPNISIFTIDFIERIKSISGETHEATCLRYRDPHRTDSEDDEILNTARMTVK